MECKAGYGLTLQDEVFTYHMCGLAATANREEEAERVKKNGRELGGERTESAARIFLLVAGSQTSHLVTFIFTDK